MIKKINGYLSSDATKITSQTYEITLEEIPTLLAASIRFTGKYSEIGEHIPFLYKAVQENVNGAVINCYYDEECMEQTDMELCLPVKKQVSANTVNCRYLPAVKAVCTTHYGSHEMLHFAYKALFHYVNEHSISVITPFREVYVKGPGMVFKGTPKIMLQKYYFLIKFCKEKRLQNAKYCKRFYPARREALHYQFIETDFFLLWLSLIRRNDVWSGIRAVFSVFKPIFFSYACYSSPYNLLRMENPNKQP